MMSAVTASSVDMAEPMFLIALFRSGLTLDWDLKGAIVYRIWQMTLAIACEMLGLLQISQTCIPDSIQIELSVDC